MSPSSSNRFTTAISTWLLVEGVWGLFSPEVFGVLSTNRLHAVIHLALAFWGLKSAFVGGAKTFLWLVGVLLVVLGMIYFIPGGQSVTDLLAVNEAVAVLNLVLGGASLYCAARCDRHSHPPARATR
jgi:hypothetical protein